MIGPRLEKICSIKEHLDKEALCVMQLEIGKNKNIRHPDNTTTVNKSEQDYKSNYLVREKGWEACKSGKYMQRGPPPKHFLSPKSHILDSNGVWYSSF